MRRSVSFHFAVIVALLVLMIGLVVAWAFGHRWADHSHAWWVVVLVVVGGVAAIGGMGWLQRRYDL